jgi:hypothetical protein
MYTSDWRHPSNGGLVALDPVIDEFRNFRR